MRIQLLTQYYPPEPGSGSMKMSELAEYLAQKGHQVTVVTAYPNRPLGKVHDGYKMGLWMRERINRKPEVRNQRSEIRGQKSDNASYEIIRVPLYVTSHRMSFKHRMMNHLSFMATATYGGLLAGKPDLIYFYSPPIFSGFTAWALKKIYKVPTMMELNDLWPAAAISMGVIKNHSVRKMAEGFEKLVYRKTDRLSFYSNIHRQTIVNKGIPQDKTEIHKLWVDTELFCPQDNDNAIKGKSRAEIREKYRFDDKFVVLYAGKIGYAQGLDVVIEAATRLKGNPDILFTLMGEGPEEGNLKRMANERNLSNVIFIPYQPVDQVPQFLWAADALYAQLAPAPHRLGTIPAKVLSYMSMGRPVIAAAKGETENLVQESRVGICIEPNDPKALAEAVLALHSNKEREAMGAAGREYALKHFDKTKLLNQLEARLIEIANGKG